MTSPISTRMHGDVLIVTSNNPPVNALGHAVREGLVKGIEEADADPSVKAVVIICQGNTFFAGADISEFGTPKSFEYPALPQVVDIIENCSKPVVAAISSAFPTPATRGSRCVPPAPGRSPSFTSGTPSLAEGTATR